MAEIDAYADVLGAEQRAAWARVASLARDLNGVLMGGTAVAVHLRHRYSDDLDVMTMRNFSGTAVAARLQQDFTDVNVVYAHGDSCGVIADGVRIDVFKALARSSVGPRGIRRVQKGPVVCGMPVGSLPDLLATKLEIIRFRPKLRDYLDLYAIDTASNYSLEDGVSFYCRRFGHDGLPSDFGECIRLLADAGTLPADPQFEQRKPEVLAHLSGRSAGLATHAAHQYSLTAGPLAPAAPSQQRAGPPLPAAPPAVPAATAGGPPATTAARAPQTASRQAKRSRCGKWMPLAKRHCTRPRRHRGGCR